MKSKVYCNVASGKEDGGKFMFWLTYKVNIRIIWGRFTVRLFVACCSALFYERHEL